MEKRLKKLLFSAVGLLLLAVVLIAANYAAGKLNFRIDCTQQRTNTLSAGTERILKEIKAPVTVKFYYSSDVAQMPIPFKNYAERVQNLLKEYKRMAGKKLLIEKLNPSPDSDAEDSANLNGIYPEQLPSGDNVYLGIAVSSLDQSFTLPFLSLDREDFLEYDLSSAIARVSKAGGKPVIGLISSLPLAGKQAPMVMMGGPRQQEPPWLLYNELKKDYDLRDLGMDFDSIPENIQTLLIVHPKLSPSALFALDQFVLRGGRLIAFVDPFSVVDAKNAQGGNNMFGPPQTSSTLGQLFDAWGIKFDTNSVVGDLQLATQLRGADGDVQRDPTWLSLTDANIAQNDPSVAQLHSLLMILAGQFTGEGADGLKRSVLLKTSGDSGTVNNFVAQMGGESVNRDLKTDGKEKALAIRLEGKFKTAFPEGSPDKKGEAKKDGAKALKTSAKDGLVLLVSDTDMLYDSFCARMQSMFGQKFATPLNDNLAFVQNALGLLTGDDALTSLRSRGVIRRPFLIVDKLQAKAEKKFREQIKALEVELANAQQKIEDLRQQKGDISSQKFIMSPEVKDTIAKFKKQEAETRSQLKALRKSLRKDIDSLEMKVKWANMALVPAFVALVGIAVGVTRRWRSKS